MSSTAAEVTPDAGLLACRELDDVLGFTGVAVSREEFAVILERINRLRPVPV